MPKVLPVRANLEHLKSQAKDLLEAFRRGEPEALRRFRESLPSAAGVPEAAIASMPLALHDAQSVIAREYALPTWNALRERVAESAPTPEMMRALLQPHLSLPLPPEVVQSTMLAASSAEPPNDDPPAAKLPLLPLRNALLTVGAVAPLNLGQPSSLLAIEAARRGGGLLAVFAQKDETAESPSLASLHPVGCVARLLSTVATPDRGTWFVVRGVRWIKLEEIEQAGEGHVARIARFAIVEEESEEVRTLEERLREQVRAFAANLPNGAMLLRMTETMTALQLADVTIANTPCSVEEKARYASEPSLAKRLSALLALIAKLA